MRDFVQDVAAGMLHGFALVAGAPVASEATQLQHISQLYDNNKSAVSAEQLSLGCLPDLVKLLRDSLFVEVRRQAARALGKLATQGAGLSQLIGQDPKAVAGIISLLGGSSESQLVAALAIARLAWQNPSNQDRIAAESGVIKGLTAMLGSGKAEKNRPAVLALMELTSRSPANRERIGQVPPAIKGLVALLSSSDAYTQQAAACALGNLALECPLNSERISQEPGAVSALLALLSSGDARVQHRAAFAVVSAAEGSSDFVQALQGTRSAAVWLALSHEKELAALPDSELLEISRLLHRLAAGSMALRQAMAESHELLDLLLALIGRLDSRDTPDNMASATLRLLTDGGSSGVASAQAPAPAPPHNAQDAPAARGQANKTPVRPHNKLATTVELLRTLESYAKNLPIVGRMLGAVMTPLTGFLEKVEQLRVNDEKARSMTSRVEALMQLLVCIFSNQQMWRGALPEDAETVLENQLTRLGNALWKATGLLTKWSEPMLLGAAVRFVKGNLDKEDIKDFENTINKAIQDLSATMASLNLIRTLEVQQQLQQMASDAKARQEGLDQQLEQANKKDMEALRDHLDVLVGGQEQLREQLAVATQEQLQAWDQVNSSLGQLEGHVGGLRGEVRELADIVRAIEEHIKQQPTKPVSSSTASSNGQLVRSRYILGRERVQWDSRPRAHGGTATVYSGTWDGTAVAVKLLHLSGFRGDEQSLMLREAAVLSRLNHPCIVRFWGYVPVDDSKAQQPEGAAQGSVMSTYHDSANSHASTLSPSSHSNSSSSLSLGLVMDKCDYSLAEVLTKCDRSLANVLGGGDRSVADVLKRHLPLSKALHIAERIACGLKYLHEDAPLSVVHGDLKPANVLLKRGTKTVQLTDFGLSHTIAVQTQSMCAVNLVGQNGAGQSGYTLQWTAPEVLDGFEGGLAIEPTYARDVYAFGIILHQLLVGKAPYKDQYTSPELLKSSVRAGGRPSWDGWEDARSGEATAVVLGKLRALVEECWAQAATQRPDAQEVHTKLVELKGELAAV